MNRQKVRDSILSNQKYVYYLDHLRVCDKRTRTDKAINRDDVHLFGDLIESFRHHRLYVKDGAMSVPVSASGNAIRRVAVLRGYKHREIDACKRQSERRVKVA